MAEQPRFALRPQELGLVADQAASSGYQFLRELAERDDAGDELDRMVAERRPWCPHDPGTYLTFQHDDLAAYLAWTQAQDA